MTALRIRDAVASDLAAIHALNEESLPELSSEPASFFPWWKERAFALRVAERGEAFAGFLLAMDPGAQYDSPNFRFFQARFDRFVYVDRIAVRLEHRGRGVGAALYRDLAERVHAIAAGPRITCEVNLRPRNQPSLDFHARLGFVEVGRQEVREKEVLLMSWELDQAP